MSFSVLGIPLPRRLRWRFLEYLFFKGCKRLVFWSHAGQRTLQEYEAASPEVKSMSTVVHPAIGAVDERFRCQYEDCEQLNILFSGDFFRKGGANVVDAFERLQTRYSGLRLQLCCSPEIDFKTSNLALRSDYLGRIKRNPQIKLGRVTRDQMLTDVLPSTDIFVSPTYLETFGFAVLEAMAYGIPILTTNYFALPEMIDHETSGLLIDTSDYDCEMMFPGYRVNSIPPDFHSFMTESVFGGLARLIESRPLRQSLGTQAVTRANSDFSFETRNPKMRKIYEAALV